MNLAIIRNVLVLTILIVASHITVVNATEKMPLATKVVIGVPLMQESPADTQYHQLIQFIKAYWLLWGEQYNYQVSFANYHIHEMKNALARRDIDIISTGFYESTRHAELLFSTPYVAFKTILYRHVDAKNENRSIAVLEPRFFDTNVGNRLQRKLVGNGGQLFNQEADYVWSWSPMIAESAYKKSTNYGLYISEYLDEKIPVRAITRHFDRDIMLDINRGIRELNKSKLTLLWQRIIHTGNSDFELLAGNYTREISQQSQEVLVDNPVLTFAYIAQGAAPYFIENDINVKGYYIDYLDALSKSMGVTFKAQRYNSFNEVLVALKKQQVDIFPGLFKTDKRSNYVSFTHAIDQAQLAIVSYEHLNSINKLNGVHIAAVRGLHETEILKRHLTNKKISIYATAEEAMSAVANREVDAYFGNILNIANLMATMHVSNLQIYKIDNIQDDLALRIGVNKNNRELIQLLNIGIKDLGLDFQETLHLGWQQALLASQDNKLQKNRLNKVIAFSVIVIVIFLLLFCFYQWQLGLRSAQQYKVEKALKESKVATEKAVELAKSKTEFLARMSHEIRTPMNGVLGMAEALTFTDLSSDQEDLLNTLNSSARNLMALLNDVLDFSKMDAGKLTLEMLPTELSLVLQGVMDTFRHKAASSGLNFNLFIDEKLSDTYLLDGVRLMQVVNNVVSNSLKFTEKGYIELRVELIDDQYAFDNGATQHLIHIEVRDSGIGIPASKIDTLFDPFVQAEGDITRRFGGTGLGLSICKEIVEEMQGVISVDSKVDYGSVFSIALPLTVAEALPLVKMSDVLVNHNEQHDKFASLNILLAEDNAVNRKVIEGQLTRIGITQLTLAVDGEEALTLFKEGDYDIVISDCHMPKMDGFALASAIKTLKTNRKPWVIALTADALSGAAKRCLEAGFDDYLSKPCPSEVLAGKLSLALNALSDSEQAQDSTEQLILLAPLENADVVGSDVDIDADIGVGIGVDIDADIGVDIDVDIEADFESLLAELQGENSHLPGDEENPVLLAENQPIGQTNSPAYDELPNEFTHLNIAHVDEMNAGDQELIAVIFAAFLAAEENDRQELMLLHQAKRWQDLQSSAHRIKGCVLYLGAQKLGDIACEIETSALSMDAKTLAEKVNMLCLGIKSLAQEVGQYQLMQEGKQECKHEVA